MDPSDLVVEEVEVRGRRESFLDFSGVCDGLEESQDGHCIVCVIFGFMAEDLLSR